MRSDDQGDRPHQCSGEGCADHRLDCERGHGRLGRRYSRRQPGKTDERRNQEPGEVRVDLPHVSHCCLAVLAGPEMIRDLRGAPVAESTTNIPRNQVRDLSACRSASRCHVLSEVCLAKAFASAEGGDARCVDRRSDGLRNFVKRLTQYLGAPEHGLPGLGQ